eukprot:CAMPEP_0174894942 /NCGR_PEP_ID=MMETSP0167-20121228/9460_1 /TAXON_ID=38298 /ORGANISM="Rhodella maculata, Strain CCMP736" /LENGTH=79 /DNA_ID=CAMNT_0016134153 /DNA_START=31 /DNA_END=270 /DNA_ORIENTATION=-
MVFLHKRLVHLVQRRLPHPKRLLQHAPHLPLPPLHVLALPPPLPHRPSHKQAPAKTAGLRGLGAAAADADFERGEVGGG